LSAADPRDLVARPAFAQFLAALRGGEEKCPRCKGGGRVRKPLADEPSDCDLCEGPGRVAVPPDLAAAHMAADWWQEQGGDLAGMLWAYAFPSEWRVYLAQDDRNAGVWKLDEQRRHYRIRMPPEQDDSLRVALVALTERDDDPRVRALAAAARVLRPGQDQRGRWYVSDEPGWAVSWHRTEPAARLALKRAVLSLFDPLVRVPCRAEGPRLTFRYRGGPESELPREAFRNSDGRRLVPGDLNDEYYLDGVRLGAPPDWSWTPHALPCGKCEGTGKWCRPKRCPPGVHACEDCGGSGERLVVTWDAAPSSLLPATEQAAPEFHARQPTEEELRWELARMRAERAWRREEPLY
jgi:hypothetical protein